MLFTYLEYSQNFAWVHSQGYKMDDLLTSYISQMLTTMNKRRGRDHSKWSSYWQGAKELVQILRPVGQPCSWARTFAHQLWTMSRSPSAGSAESLSTLKSSTGCSGDPAVGGSSTHDHVLDDDDDDWPSSEEDYLWDTTAGDVHSGVPQLDCGDQIICRVWMVAWGDLGSKCRDWKIFVVVLFFFNVYVSFI